jgi:hypothetical protein
MNPDELRDQLAKLHEELGAARQVDPRSAQLLTEIMNDIKRLTETSPALAGSGTAAGRAPSDAPLSLPGRLERIAIDFEAQHPTLAASSRRLVDLLGKAGL